MPFTPLHMGPGIVVKAVMRRYFSLMVFGKWPCRGRYLLYYCAF